MRKYMYKPHRDFLDHLSSVAGLRRFMSDCEAAISSSSLSSSSSACAAAAVGAGVEDDDDNSAAVDFAQLKLIFEECLSELKQFRSIHLNVVAEYIMAQQQKTDKASESIEGSAGGKGTGGTELMKFLKPIRDNCQA